MRSLGTIMVVWLTAVGAAGVGATHFPPYRITGGNTYFACEPGLVFEVSGAAARCRRLGTVLTAPLNPCPQAADGVPLTERVDQAGEKDMCAASNAAVLVSVERRCPTDYTLRVIVGPDRCEKPSPELIQAPGVPVLR